MPILIKNYQWTQSEDTVTITFALTSAKHHVNTATENILITDKFIKFNSSPYYFELFLLHTIDKEQSVCRILETNVKFLLRKVSRGIWEHLAIEPDAMNRSALLELKKEILKQYELDTAAARKLNIEQKSEMKKQIMDRELKREQDIRKKIDDIYAGIKMAEMEKLEKRKKPVPVVQQCGERRKQQPPIHIPPIRNAGHINIEFTPRAFITPQRESQEHAEREWCLKQHELKKNIGFDYDDLNAEERNPRWLLEKGNDFYQKKNYLAAISAYTTGINIASNPAVLLVNRAAVHFELEHYERCAIDTSKAYELFQPAVSSNLKDRIKCVTLRGRALHKLGFVKEAYDELKAGLHLDPHDVDLRNELELLEKQIVAEKDNKGK